MFKIKTARYSESFSKLIEEPLKESLEKDAFFDVVLDNPKIISHTTISYEFNDSGGRELRPEHSIGFTIPKEFRNRLVRDVTLKHRKDQKYAKDIGPDRHDPYGAYSLVELHDRLSDRWLSWSDPKGYSPTKFAEPRPSSDPENEVLHDWIATVGKVQSDVIKVTNVGKNPDYSVSQIHGLEVVFFPDLEGVIYQERIYSQGTNFIDLKNDKFLPTYGGGSHTEGIYSGALALNQHGDALYEPGTDPGLGARLEKNRLHIKLEKGRNLVQIEVAIGDTEHLDHINPKTNRKTRLGYSKLWVGIKKKDSDEVDWFIKNTNIPPQGVISGGPKLDNGQIEDGDELIIEARDDTAYVMGWRLAYK